MCSYFLFCFSQWEKEEWPQAWKKAWPAPWHSPLGQPEHILELQKQAHPRNKNSSSSFVLKGKMQVLTVAGWSPSTSGSDRCLWRMTFGSHFSPPRHTHTLASPSTSWDPSPKAQFTPWLFGLNMCFPGYNLHPPGALCSMRVVSGCPCSYAHSRTEQLSLYFSPPVRDLLFFSHLIGNWVRNGYESRE